MLVNLTCHPLKFLQPNKGTFWTLPSSVPGATSGERFKKCCQVFRGKLINLPKPEKGVFYIVRADAARAAWEIGRRDVLAVGARLEGEGEIRILSLRSISWWQRKNVWPAHLR